MRPVFCGSKPPSKELTVATFGSARTIAAARSCSATIAGNADVLGRLGADPQLADVFLGKKPFGIVTNSQAVAANVAQATNSTANQCPRARSSVRV